MILPKWQSSRQYNVIATSGRCAASSGLNNVQRWHKKRTEEAHGSQTRRIVANFHANPRRFRPKSFWDRNELRTMLLLLERCISFQAVKQFGLRSKAGLVLQSNPLGMGAVLKQAVVARRHCGERLLPTTFDVGCSTNNRRWTRPLCLGDDSSSF